MTPGQRLITQHLITSRRREIYAIKTSEEKPKPPEKVEDSRIKNG